MNNQNMNNITAATHESHEIAINITRKAFVGLARQGMLFHQGILEGCDDALAAALAGEKARICVALAPDADITWQWRTGAVAWILPHSPMRFSWAVLR